MLQTLIVALAGFTSLLFSAFYAIKAYNVSSVKKVKTATGSTKELVRHNDKVVRYVWTSWFLLAIGTLIVSGVLLHWWLIAWLIAILGFIPYAIFFKPYFKSGWYVATPTLVAVAAVVTSMVSSILLTPPVSAEVNIGISDVTEVVAVSEKPQSSEDKQGGCPAEFVQTGHMANDDTRIDDTLAKTILSVKKEAKNLPENKRSAYVSDELEKAILTMMGHNYRALISAAITFDALPASKNTAEQNAKLLTPDGSCLSEEGQQLYHMTKAIMGAFVESYSEADVPEGAVNSGFNNGELVVANFAGIYGDRSGLSMNLKDGNKVFVLGRCANWSFSPNGKLVTKLPPGKTDNPKPDKPKKPDKPTPPLKGKGTSNPDSQHDFWGDVSGGGGETTPPPGPMVSDDGGSTWKPTKPAKPSTPPGSPAPPTVQAPNTGGKPSENNDLTQPTPPNGGVTVNPDSSGTTPSGGTKPTTDPGDDNNETIAPPPD